MFTPDQIFAAQRSNLETLSGLTAKAFEGFEQLVGLNLQVVKTVLTENLDGAKRALSAKTPQEFLEIQTSLVQPAGEKAVAYARQVYEITSGTQKKLAKAAKATMTEGSQKLREAVDNLAKNAPAGSESVVAIVKSAIVAADNAYESVEKAATQAVEIAESNLEAAAKVATNAAEQAAAKAIAASKKAAA